MEVAYSQLSHPLPDPLVELIARRFSVLAEPMRIKILDLLREREEASVQELAGALGAGHANVSKHLTILHAAAIVGRRKDGTRVLYRLVDPGVIRLCEDVCGGLGEQLRELGALFEDGGGAR